MQITKENFQALLKGEQKVEHRYVYPSNQRKYVKFKCNGKVYDTQDDIPDGDADIDVVPVEYDVPNQWQA